MISEEVRVQRLRPAHTAEQCRELYAGEQNRTMTGRGHSERIRTMIEMGFSKRQPWASAADLSCGTGSVLDAIPVIPGQRTYGDIAQVGDQRYLCGPIEQTILQITPKELFVCGETLEHLDIPVEMLYQIRMKADALLLSTPIDAWDDTWHQHYWAWSRGYVEMLLRHTGWAQTISYTEIDSTQYGEQYKYGIWLVK